jgi:hypothetical protein
MILQRQDREAPGTQGLFFRGSSAKKFWQNDYTKQKSKSNRKEEDDPAGS